MAEYISNGARLGWLIDRLHRTVYIYRPDRPGQDPQMLSNPAQVSGDPELPGFELPLTKIW